MPKEVNWHPILADLVEIAMEGGYAIEEKAGETFARRGMDRAVNLSDVAIELAKRGYRK